MSDPAPKGVPAIEINPGDLAERLYAQARGAAAADLRNFAGEVEALQKHAARIAQAGEVYAFGYREVCRKLAEAAAGALDQLALVDAKVRRFD